MNAKGICPTSIAKEAKIKILDNVTISGVTNSPNHNLRIYGLDNQDTKPAIIQINIVTRVIILRLKPRLLKNRCNTCDIGLLNNNTSKLNLKAI
jgi:hypothetical protein